MDRLSNLPETLRQLPDHLLFVERLCDHVRGDDRFDAILLGGSAIRDAMDAQSDLDFVLVAAEQRHSEVMDGRIAIAEAQGDLLSAFTGEHVGEPRLLVCLYGPPLLHVDLKFVRASDLNERVEDGLILWERDGVASRCMAATPAHYPIPDRQWIEDRFWVIVHYAAARAERGELMEAVASCIYLITQFLGPLVLQSQGAEPNGVRRIEQVDAEWAARLAGLTPEPTAASCYKALDGIMAAYRDLREKGGADLQLRSEAELAVGRFVADLRSEQSESSAGWAGKHSARLHRRRGRRP